MGRVTAVRSSTGSHSACQASTSAAHRQRDPGGDRAEAHAQGAGDLDSMPLPPNLDWLVRDIRPRIDGGATPVS
jgi:hypothetical protein